MQEVDPFSDQNAECDALRFFVTSRVLRGCGLDIGALHRPMPVPEGVKVTYVDRMSRAELLEHYPELSNFALTEADVIDNGETLEKFGDASQDFVIASHFIEHTEDPIRTIKTYCRVVKPGGIILLLVPERRAYFDKERPLTTLDHLIQDHELGPASSRRSHYVEYAEFVDGGYGEDPFIHAKKIFEKKYSIHYHVWTGESFLEHVAAFKRRYALPIELIAGLRPANELIAVYRRL